MRKFGFTRWSGRVEIVKAESVEFAPGGVLVFRNDERIVLAVKSTDWNDLTEEADCG